jgi:3D (Asp-Asp-Asp) domain-containing protein
VVYVAEAKLSLFSLPADAASAYFGVRVGGTTVTPVPQFAVKSVAVNSVSPTNGPIGSQVQINGTGFGATQGTGSVIIGSRTIRSPGF